MAHEHNYILKAVMRQAEFRASFDDFSVYLSSVFGIKCCGKNPARTQSRKPLPQYKYN